MSKHLALRIGTHPVSIALNDTASAQAMAAAAPFEGRANRWGDELYFATPVAAAAGDALVETVEAGTVALWPPGRALCLFWGPTPLSVGDEIRPASPVVVIGQITAPADWAVLDEALDGAPVQVLGDAATDE